MYSCSLGDIGAAEPGFPVNTRKISRRECAGDRPRSCVHGSRVRDVLDLLTLNSRVPKTLMGDLNAQLAAIELGRRRSSDLVGDSARASALHSGDLRNTEVKFRSFMRRIPDGVYGAEGASDNDGMNDDPFRFECVSQSRETISGSIPPALPAAPR